MDEQRLQTLRDAASRILPPYGVLAAYVYGSRVSGNPRPDSDLDVGYYLVEHRKGARLELADEMRLASALADVLGLEVDLRNLGDAPLELRGRVLEDGVRIYSGNDVDRVGLERELLGRYHDYNEVFQNMHELRLRSIAERGI